MLRVNIVVGNADLHWIAGRLARELVLRLPAYGVDASLNDERDVALTYHQIVYGAPTRRPAVGMFTHGSFRPAKFAEDYDGHIGLNPVMFDYLVQAGAPNPALIQLPIADVFKKTPIVFGVCGRTYADGRKGEHLVANMVAAGFTVRAWGSGWPCEIVGDRVEDLPLFYAGLDYYIDTSTDEGGCIPALEAMACGVPVISHTVGVDRPVLAYDMSDWDSLHAVLRSLTQPVTYDDWARSHAEYFRQVVG